MGNEIRNRRSDMRLNTHKWMFGRWAMVFRLIAHFSMYSISNQGKPFIRFKWNRKKRKWKWMTNINHSFTRWHSDVLLPFLHSTHIVSFLGIYRRTGREYRSEKRRKCFDYCEPKHSIGMSLQSSTVELYRISIQNKTHISIARLLSSRLNAGANVFENINKHACMIGGTHTAWHLIWARAKKLTKWLRESTHIREQIFKLRSQSLALTSINSHIHE